MSRGNAQVVRAFMIAEDGRDRVRELVHPDVVYVNPPDAIEPGTRHGIDSFIEALDQLDDSFGEWSVDETELIEAGDRVVLLGTFHIRGRTSGASITDQRGFLLNLRDGKISRFEWFYDHRSALEAAGSTR